MVVKSYGDVVNADIIAAIRQEDKSSVCIGCDKKYCNVAEISVRQPVQSDVNVSDVAGETGDSDI